MTPVQAIPKKSVYIFSAVLSTDRALWHPTLREQCMAKSIRQYRTTNTNGNVFAVGKGGGGVNIDSNTWPCLLPLSPRVIHLRGFRCPPRPSDPGIVMNDSLLQGSVRNTAWGFSLFVFAWKLNLIFFWVQFVGLFDLFLFA